MIFYFLITVLVLHLHTSAPLSLYTAQEQLRCSDEATDLRRLYRHRTSLLSPASHNCPNRCSPAPPPEPCLRLAGVFSTISVYHRCPVKLASKIIMKRRRHQLNELKNEDNKDKLSNLPECVFLHILSFLKTRDAVQFCLLSRRWNYLWKHLPILTLDSNDFRTLKAFTKFVTQILSCRDSSTALALDIKRHGIMEPHILKRIVRTVSHNVNHIRLSCEIDHIPPSLFSCPSLTSLDLCIRNQIFPNSLNLPALTILKLEYFSFCCGNDGRVEPFSTFNRLNTLTLMHCKVPNVQKPLCISSTTLLDLSFFNYSQGPLKIELSTPNLSIFAFGGIPFQKLSGSHLSSIKQVSIDIRGLEHYVETTLGLLNWLIEITNIESLTVTPNTLQALSLIPDMLKLKLPSYCNLKSLQIDLGWESDRFSAKMRRDIKMELAGGKSWKENAKLQETIKRGLKPIHSSILDGMIDFLLQKSPSAKLDKVIIN